MTPRRRADVRRTILGWYRMNRRDFLWRSTRDPYVILLSEIMLQQTQTSRAQERLPLFLRRFPSIEALAHANVGDVVRAWRGLGYNNRAVRLRELARVVVTTYNGSLPDSPERLLALPGVGPYTSRAIACFAFGRRVEVVDVNVRRVLSRIFRRMNDTHEVLADSAVRDVAIRLLPRDAYTWNQALMELGSLICTARTPACSVCPVRTFCLSSRLEQMSRRTPRTRTRRTKAEPAYAGIPNRLWRGKVVGAVALLAARQAISLHRLGRTIKSDFTASDIDWLTGVTRQLERDGILELRGTAPQLRIRLSNS